MGHLETSLLTLLRYLKIRFLIISIVLIISALILPIWLPYVPDYNPVYSINSEGENGHSNLIGDVTNYNIQQGYDGRTNYEQHDLVVIINPQEEISYNKIQELYEAHARGVAVIIVGKSSVDYFGGYFEYSIMYESESTNRIFDSENNGGENYMPLITYKESTFVSLVPTSVENYNFGSITPIQTMSTAGYANCYRDDSPCLSSYSIGFVRSNFGLIADNWIFSNRMTSQFSENIQLFWDLVYDLIGISGSILFEESFYEWAPLNEKGVMNFIHVRLNTVLVVLILLVLSVLIPLLIAYQGKVFEKEPRMRSRSARSVEERLNFIHVDRLPAAPLNALEKILMEEKIEYNSRGKFYIQFVAQDLLDQLVETFESEVPSHLSKALHELSQDFYSSYSSWRVIEEGYIYLLSHKIKDVK